MNLVINPFHLNEIVGREVLINRGGPESRAGQLLAVKSDHLVIRISEEGVVYYQTGHIKSVSLNGLLLYDTITVPSPSPSLYIDVDTFQAVVKNMKNRWVQINRGGPENINGILSECWEEHILLTTNEESRNIFINHIQNINVAKLQNHDN